MTASYPSGVKSFGVDLVNGDYLLASHVNELRAEVVAVETDLLANYKLSRVLTILNGTTTYTPTAGTRALYVECYGAGGAGGGAATGSSSLSMGGGGGAGAFSAKWVTGVIKASYTVAVGAGGTGASGTTGNAGGDSTFDSPSIVTAKGGSGGATQSAGTSAVYLLGGAGGAVASGVGDSCTPGSDGGNGARGSASVGQSGFGGCASFGGGFCKGVIATNDGNGGQVYGGGGSGALTTGTAKTGGAGANGIIRIWEFA
jgi:hypothetical protein